jgi:tRNA modification GTPase
MSTVVSVLTPAGRGAIATVGLRGPQANQLLAACFRPLGRRDRDQSENLQFSSAGTVGRLIVGRFHAGEGPGEEVVVGQWSDEEIEVHCHGGVAAVRAVVSALVERGAQEFAWPEWIAQEEPDAIAAEARIALASARTERTAAILLDQLRGALRTAIEQILGYLAASAQDDTRSPQQPLQEIEQLLSSAGLGSRLVRPWQVVIAGPPNVGKSSLINAILGYERAIVSELPGTTRDVLTAATAIDGWPVELADTAGLREASDEIEAAGISRALQRIAPADLVLLVSDLSQLWTAEDRGQDKHASFATARCVLRVHNKVDLARRTGAALPRQAGDHYVSALTGEGLEPLLAAIARSLVPHVPPRGAAAAFTDRQVELLMAAKDFLHRGRWREAAERLQAIIDGPIEPRID